MSYLGAEGVGSARQRRSTGLVLSSLMLTLCDLARFPIFVNVHLGLQLCNVKRCRALLGVLVEGCRHTHWQLLRRVRFDI
jgi:hypothetical protein